MYSFGTSTSSGRALADRADTHVTLLFEDDGRGPSDDLRLRVEAASRIDLDGGSP